jgi:hypothetical protein
VMDAFVKRCDYCDEPLPDTNTTRGRPQKFCTDKCRQAHRKFAFTYEKGLRYRTGPSKAKSGFASL